MSSVLNYAREGRRSRTERWIRVGIAAFPLWLPTIFYGTWFWGWLVIGHPPDTWGQDDPKSIAGVPLLIVLAWTSLVASPIVFIADIWRHFIAAADGVCGRSSTVKWGVRFLAFWLIGAATILADPIGIVRWWND